MLITQLPKEAQEIAIEQGWSDRSIGLHLLSYIKDNVSLYEQALSLYFGAMQDEENGDAQV
jgi:hypothetical protein